MDPHWIESFDTFGGGGGSTSKLKLKEWFSYEQSRITFVGRSVPDRWKRLCCVRENKRKTR